MKLIILMGVFALAPAAMAGNASPCKDPDYIQLKIGDKKELQSEYCFAKIHAESEERMHQITEEAVAKKRAIPVDASAEEKESLELLDSRTSCRVRAAAFEIALSKRFKSKPPKSCD